MASSTALTNESVESCKFVPITIDELKERMNEARVKKERDEKMHRLNAYEAVPDSEWVWLQSLLVSCLAHESKGGFTMVTYAHVDKLPAFMNAWKIAHAYNAAKDFALYIQNKMPAFAVKEGQSRFSHEFSNAILTFRPASEEVN